MLDELHVANLGLIAEARIAPGPGLVVVTGETGAGKTLLLGALRLLLGETVRKDRVGPAGDEARVEGRFVGPPAEGDPENEFTVARHVVTSGKSRAYLDGAMVPARVLASRTAGRVEIVAQHDHLHLLRPAGVRSLVDAALDPEGRTVAATYRSHWERLRELRADHEAVGGDRRALARELEIARHEADEIADARVTEDEVDELERRLGRLRHAEELTAGLGLVAEALGDDGVGRHLASAATGLRRLVNLAPELSDQLGQLDHAAALLGDLGADVAGVAADLEHDPGELESLERRAEVVASLRRKYGETVAEVIAYGTQAAARADELSGLLARAESLDEQLEDQLRLVEGAGDSLRDARRRAAETLTASACLHLGELGLMRPVVAIDVEPADPGPHGADRLELRFASDEALEPAPVHRIASGGELSRLVLSLRLASGIADAAVLAFDEIDAGIGGVTALAMGRKLASLAHGRQVLCVTHLPQVAAFADTHLVVERGGEVASVRRVEGDDRLEELTRMLSGLAGSAPGRDHAEELLASAARARQDDSPVAVAAAAIAGVGRVVDMMRPSDVE